MVGEGLNEGPSAAAKVSWQSGMAAYSDSSRKRPMSLDPQTQGDTRTKKHADVCNGYLPTEVANEEERKVVLQLV